MDSNGSLATRLGQPRVTTSNGELLSSPEHTRTTTQDIYHNTTPTNTSNQSFCKFGAMCTSAPCPWRHPNNNGAAQRPPREEGSYTPPRLQCAPTAVSAPTKGKRAPSREARTQPTNWEQRPCRFLLGGRVVSFFGCFEVIFGVGFAYAARTPLVLHASELRGGGVGGRGGRVAEAFVPPSCSAPLSPEPLSLPPLPPPPWAWHRVAYPLGASPASGHSGGLSCMARHQPAVPCTPPPPPLDKQTTPPDLPVN